MIAWIVGLALAVCVIAGFTITYRKIGTVGPGRHAGRGDDFDWSDATRPLFKARPRDQLDRLADRYWMPQAALDDLYRVDQLLAEADAVLAR